MRFVILKIYFTPDKLPYMFMDWAKLYQKNTKYRLYMSHVRTDLARIDFPRGPE